MNMNINELYNVIEKRKIFVKNDSYISSLFLAGMDRIIQKVGEESVEVIIAAKNESRKRVISEVADLLFHVLILLSALRISPDDIMEELTSRRKST